MVNKVIEHKLDIVCKNFYNDLYDIIENNKLDEREALTLLGASFSTILVQTFQDDTPQFIKLVKQQYETIVKEHGSIAKFMEENGEA